MRPLRLLALVPSVVPALLVAVSCKEVARGPGAASSREAGPANDDVEPGPRREAGVKRDAAAGDDAHSPPRGVTVTVMDGTTPREAVRVISHDAAGAVIGEAQTDGAGKATFDGDAAAPAMITVLDSAAAKAPAAVTFLGVEDGDKLTVDLRGQVQADPAQLGSYSVGFAANDVTKDATLYQAYVGGSCSGQAEDAKAPIVVPLVDSCLGAKNAALVRASGKDGDLGFAFAKDIAKPSGKKAVDVPMKEFKAAGVTQVKARHLPEGGEFSARLGALANGRLFAMSEKGGTLDTGIDYATPTGFADGYQTSVTMTSHPDGGGSAQTTLTRREPTMALASSNLAAFNMESALPLLTTPEVVDKVAGRPEITIKSEAPIKVADYGVLRLSWTAEEDGGTSNGAWTVIMPPTTTSVTLPALPDDAKLFTPVSPITVRTVTILDVSTIPSYTQAKNTVPMPASAPLDLVDLGRPLAFPGLVKVTSLDTTVD
ncbi:MAG: hypothetical protein JWP87_904 [Labilithrix sp.]|nr:hypothetical protein [Labilithrix sp.]